MQKIILAMFLVISSNLYAGLNINDVKITYQKLVRANNVVLVPALVIDIDEDDNAYSNCSTFTIGVNTGMLSKLHNRHELARVLGHELGHFVTSCATGKKYEYISDRIAKQYLEKAGYNTCKAAKYLKRRNTPDSFSHPADIDRVKALGCH